VWGNAPARAYVPHVSRDTYEFTIVNSPRSSVDAVVVVRDRPILQD
jgi:hypothetical protein